MAGSRESAADQAAIGGIKINRPEKTLRELAYENMRLAIFDSYFKPGERLRERSLCEDLGVSRSIVREVIRQLETEGLVEVVPRQGPVVATIDWYKAKQVYEVRGMLEALAVRDCAERATQSDLDELADLLAEMVSAHEDGSLRRGLTATTKFYEIVFRVGDKPVAWEIVQSLNARITHLRAMTMSTPNRQDDSIPELRRIYEAVASSDPIAAERASWTHINTVMAIAESVLSDCEN